MKYFRVELSMLILSLSASICGPAAAKQYYAHEVVEDEYGVIAPWYQGQNGQCDFRVRIAMETLKRYPWADAGDAVTPAPCFVFDGRWLIDSEGKITIPDRNVKGADNHGIPNKDWTNGDLGSRAYRGIFGFIEYYRYTGDPAALSYIKLFADYILDYCQTPEEHPWPRILISCPTRGKLYCQCEPTGFIQLDHVAGAGTALVKAYKLTGEERWLNSAQHWADLFAEHCNFATGGSPWPRYANPEDVPWGSQPDGNRMTGGAAWVVAFLDELIEMGYTGSDNSLVKARDAGRAYLREVLLPKWADNPSWGYNYWDGKSPSSNHNVVYNASRYLMHNPEYFPNWQNDVRNIMTVMLNRTSINPTGKTGVYSGAWAHPESTGCCGDANGYGPQRTAGLFLEYAKLTGSDWAREIGRRMSILSSYDIKENGVVLDSLFGNRARVANRWFSIAVCNPILFFLRNMSFLPAELGANRENHIMSVSSVVRSVEYAKGNISYTTFDAVAPAVDVLRVAFRPEVIQADGQILKLSNDSNQNGYRLQGLAGGDFLVTIRHDGAQNITIKGNDPQEQIDNTELQYEGQWKILAGGEKSKNTVHTTSEKGASASYRFVGNQVRVIGEVNPRGGRAEVYIDGEKQRSGIDFWCPYTRIGQVLYYKNGLKAGEHTIKIVGQGEGNPLSQGKNIYIDAIQYSAAEGNSGFGTGGGPTESQRFLLGYAGREPYVDSQGKAWRPTCEVCIPPIAGKKFDTVETTWWTTPQTQMIENSADPELYKYGMHNKEFKVNFTVGPGTYHVRIKLAETRKDVKPADRSLTILINDQEVVAEMDTAATAGGFNRAVDLVFNDIQPQNGIIAVIFRNQANGEAAAQAVEVGPGKADKGVEPVTVK